MAEVTEPEDTALDPVLTGVERDPDAPSSPVVEDDDGDEDEADADDALDDAKHADERADKDAKGKDSSGIER